MQMSPHSLDTQMTSNDAVPCFTSQSQGLPAYACKTTSSTDIKLATRMRQKLPLWAQKSEKGSGEGHSPSLWERDTPSSHHTPSAHLAPRSSRLPWFVPHFLNRGYARDHTHGKTVSGDDDRGVTLSKSSRYSVSYVFFVDVHQDFFARCAVCQCRSVGASTCNAVRVSPAIASSQRATTAIEIVNNAAFSWWEYSSNYISDYFSAYMAYRPLIGPLKVACAAQSASSKTRSSYLSWNRIATNFCNL